MGETKFGGRLLLTLMIITLVLSTINVSSNKRAQQQNREEYMELLVKERAEVLDKTLFEFEIAGDTLAKNMMSAMENPYGMKQSAEREEYYDLARPMMESTYAQVPYTTSFYMHFNPLLVSATEGLTMKPDEKSGKLKEGSVINLDAYKSTELEMVGWYYVTLEMGKPIWMESYQRDNMDEYKVSYLMPLNRNDAVVGVLGMDMPISVLFDSMNQLGLQDTAEVYLSDKSGNVLSQNGKDKKVSGKEYTYSLRNGMTLTIVDQGAKKTSSWYQTVLVLIYIFTLLIVIGAIILSRINKTRGFSDEGRYVLLLRFGLRVAMIVILVIQLGFLSYSYGEIERAPKVKTKAKNSGSETIRVVGDIDMAPYSYKDSKGKLTGHDIEVVNILANRMGVKVSYELMTYDEAQTAVKTGDADILMGYESVTEDSNFISSSYTVEDSYVIYGKTSIQGVMDLYDKKIAVVEGNQGIDIYGIEKNATVYDNYTDALESVNKGENDYVIVRSAVAQELVRENDYDLIQVFDMMGSKMSLATSSKNKDLAQRVEETVESMRKDGTLDRLQDKWVTRTNGVRSVKDVIFNHIWFFGITFIMFVGCAVAWIISHVKRLDEATKAELKALSEIDHLTKIYNRQAGEEKVNTFLQEKTPGLFCLLDIDKFKSINDRFGHPVGDLVLSEVAECLMRAYKDPAVIMRFGGDEFAFFIPNVKEEAEAREWVNRLFEYIDAIVIRELQERRVEISVGAYLYDGETEGDFMAMYKYADVALYDSKDVLGNYVTF